MIATETPTDSRLRVRNLPRQGMFLAQQIAVEGAPDTRTTMKEYVVKEKIRPVTVKERVTVGATLPTEVQLQPAPLRLR